ncbi:D-beta-hydroxybutyrate dehydrogenase, mitochondrial [Macrosteles quadrilineatus]|uniref:D-beta-hydroxybutyrate dehydrogenase, mitochondrial n=1 Tax=Macrosteles quadrilineatus TaxID=74068 RepID=UPI0023E2B38D|nr:D-beta-hydroxybutyrate dehydrogenase, mitochondrial [Macrosteles quadrilineatus]
MKPETKSKIPVQKKPEELPWDLVDRCFLPIVFSHAAAIILSTILNNLYISQVSMFALFFWFLVISVGSTIFYHNLKVTAAGKAVLVTGCDSRIGYAIARQLDDLGFTVIAGFPVKDEKSAKLKEESSGRLHIIQLDPTSESQILQAVLYVKNHIPQGLWALVNNVSWAAFGEIEWVPIHIFKKSTDVNFISTVRITQLFLPQIRKTKGRVINVISLLGRIAAPAKSPFCSVKFGLEAFSDCLRLEMRRWGVDVVVVEPGVASTASWFDDKAILEEAKTMWKEMSEEVRYDYGEDYFEYKVRSMPEYNAPTDVDLSPVLRSLVDAVSRTFPLARYTPVTQQEKVQALVADHLPRSVYDIIYN